MESSSAAYHNLDNLPDDIYDFYLLKLLDLDDIWTLRLVNKRLYSVVKSYNITELSFLCNSSRFRQTNWYSTTEPAKLENQLDISKKFILNNPSRNLLGLKRLRIGDYDALSIKIEDLNKFSKIQILEIGYLASTSNNALELPDLKALSIRLDYQGLQIGCLVIDAPNLNSLAIIQNYDDLIDNAIKFNQPLSIKHLRVDRYDKNILMFENLEYLEFCADYSIGFMTDDLLKFNNLKKLKFSCYFFYSPEIDKLKDIFDSKKSNLDLVLAGVRIKEVAKVDEYKRKKSILQFQVNNYGELEDNLHFISYAYYNDLERLLGSNQPTDLFNKYNSIQEICVGSKIQNENRLIYFIRKCSNLSQLKFSRSSLNQQFFDQLSTIRSLTFLCIENDEDINLNFNFIKNMSNIIRFVTDQDVQISKELNLNNFKILKYFQFIVNNQVFQINKQDKDKYSISMTKWLGLPVHEYISHNKLIKWSNYLRNKRETRSRKRKLIELR